VTVTAIVLAGGRASRFGADKLAAEIAGVALLDRAVAAVLTVADDVIVVGRDAPDPRAPGAPRPVADRAPTVRWLEDAEPFGGPLAALTAALDHARPGAAIVVGGDMPGLVPAVLALLVSRLDANPSVDAVTLAAPNRAGEPEAQPRQVLPLAVATDAARVAARAALAAGDRSLKGLVDRMANAEIGAGDWQRLDRDARTLVDVNTPGDLERVRSDAVR
jgi:molybdopterin-guanine dinucleotide biosynthesis protein A